MEEEKGENEDFDDDAESVDSQATVVIEDNTYNPITYIDCAMVEDCKLNIHRKIIILQFDGKSPTAMYQSSGTSNKFNTLAGTYLPFYGMNVKFLKAIDVDPRSHRCKWKREFNSIIPYDDSIMDYFLNFYELQISAFLGSPFWTTENYMGFANRILSHEYDEVTNTFAYSKKGRIPSDNSNLTPLGDRICVKHFDANDEKSINAFLISNKVLTGYKNDDHEDRLRSTGRHEGRHDEPMSEPSNPILQKSVTSRYQTTREKEMTRRQGLDTSRPQPGGGPCKKTRKKRRRNSRKKTRSNKRKASKRRKR